VIFSDWRNRTRSRDHGSCERTQAADERASTRIEENNLIGVNRRSSEAKRKKGVLADGAVPVFD
jgi:hypothetical protein